jgi:hypothetical protein
MFSNPLNTLTGKPHRVLVALIVLVLGVAPQLALACGVGTGGNCCPGC